MGELLWFLEIRGCWRGRSREGRVSTASDMAPAHNRQVSALNALSVTVAKLGMNRAGSW